MEISHSCVRFCIYRWNNNPKSLPEAKPIGREGKGYNPSWEQAPENTLMGQEALWSTGKCTCEQMCVEFAWAVSGLTFPLLSVQGRGSFPVHLHDRP